MTRILTICFLSFLGTQAFAQTWSKTTGPYGGGVGDLVVHPTNFTVYALASLPNNNGGAIFRSTDNGNTWTEHKPVAMANDQGYIRDLEMLSDGTLFALAYSNLYKSTDDGTTWSKVNSTQGSSTTGFDSGYEIAKNNFSGTIYVSGYDFGTNKRTIFRSSNGGSTFAKGYGHFFNELTQLSVTASGDVYALSGTQLYKSTDDGVTFTTVAAPDATTVVSLAAKSNGAELALVTSGSAVYAMVSPFTVWGAVTETNITNGTTFGPSALISYSPDNTTMFLCDNVNNKFYSRTSSSWSTTGSTTFVTSGGENAIAFAAKDNTNLYVGTNDIGVYKSINGGAGWIEANTGIEALNFNGIVVADDGSIIVGGQLAHRSTNDGTSWSRITNATVGNYYIFKATTGSPKPIVLLAPNGQASASLRSTNNGSTWTTITNTPGNASSFVSANGTKILGYSSTQLFFTSDQGTTWSAALTISGTGWPVSPNIYYAAIDQNGDIYVYLWNGTTYQFFKITPNNQTTPTTGTATQISLATIGVPDGVNFVGYSGNKIFVAGYNNASNPGRILSSTSNSGTSWTITTTSFSPFRVDTDPATNYLFLTTSNNNNYTLQLSRDGGTTFSASTIAPNSNNSTLYGYALNSSGIAFAGVSKSSVYKTSGTIVLPAAPTSLANSGTAPDRVNLSWIDNATNESRFVIEKFNGTSYDSVAYQSSNYTLGARVFGEVTGLQPNTSYTFRVTARNTAGNSSAVSITLSTLAQCVSNIPDNRSWSGSVTTIPAGTNTLTNVSIKSKGNGQYSISDVVNGPIPTQGQTVYPETFTESCGSTYLTPKYPLQPNGDGTWNGTNTLVIKWITDNGITPETTGIATLTLNVSDPIPAAPTSAAAYVYSTTGIEVSWVASAFETQYIVERATVADFSVIDRTFNVNYPSTSAVDATGLVSNTTYYYRVKAKNAAGTSASPSNTAQVTFTKPYFTLSGTVIESTAGYTTTGPVWGDFNGDGYEDIILPQLNILNALSSVPLGFRNDGSGNFVAMPLTGIVPSPYFTASAADYDNDGKLDLFITSMGSQNYLYKGNGDFTFTAVGSTPVTENVPNNTNSVDFGASWVDYNNNGLVDLFVVNSDNAKNAKLFTQTAAGTFVKESTGALPSVMVRGSVSSWADYDNDGDQDVFVTDQTSSTVNQLYKNNGAGTFTRVTGAPFDTDTNTRAFTAAWGDYNNDTFLDLFIGGSGNNLLYKNNGNGTFTKQSMPSTVTEASSSPFAGAWGDVNNDGFLDLVVSNRQGGSQFYINNNGTAFTKVANEKLNDNKLSNFGASFGDYNNDGYLDLAVSGADPNLQANTIKNLLFKNNFASGNWSEVKLVSQTSNKTAIGARVTLVAGGKTQIREVTSSSSFGSQPGQRLHFGLGATGSITSIQVRWPSGLIQTYSTPPINQIITFVEDNTGPTPSLQSPGNGSSSVATNTTLEITLNEPCTAVAAKNLVLTASGDANPTATLLVSGATVNGNKFTFTLPSSLLLNKSYSVTVDAGAFMDVYGNASAAISGWSFTTSPGPLVTSLSPANGSTNISAATTFVITFNGPVTAVAGKLIKLYNKAAPASPVGTLDATAGVLSGNSVTFTPTSKLNRQVTYQVAVDAGAFKDLAQNEFAGAAQTAWEFTTDPGPVASTFLPANAAVNVAANAQLEITFSKAVTAVAGKKIKVMDGATAIVDADVSTTGTVAGVKYTLAAPTGGWPYLKSLSVLIDPGAFIDAGQNDFVGVAASQWAFTIVEAPDVDAPVFANFTPPVSFDKGFGTQIVSIEITDNKAVTTAKLFHRSITGTTVSEIAGVSKPNNRWEFTVPETAFDQSGVQFYLTAADAAANSKRQPATGYYTVNLKYPAEIDVTNAIGFGGQKKDWKIFTYPFDGTNSIATVFDELTGDVKKDYRILKYENATAWADFPSFTSFTRGVGYFVNVKTSKAVKLAAGLVAPSNTKSDLFKVNLKQGWNMIGNPYLSNIAWADVVAFNSLTGQSADFLTYDGATNSYVKKTSAIEPFTGGFVFIAAEKNDVSIPFFGQTTPGGRTYEERFNDNDWSLPIVLEQNGMRNEFGGVGMHANARESYDDFDRVNPPFISDFAEINFSHPEHFAAHFAKDVVPLRERNIWSFTVETSAEGLARLFWNATSVRDELYLFDESLQLAMNMREIQHYSFDPRRSNRFRIFYGKDAKEQMVSNRVQLGAAFPNPSASTTTIPFSLPENNATYQVQVDVFDMMGRKVGTAMKAELKPGFYETSWTPQEGQADGIYTYRLAVSAGSANEVLTGKLMLKK